MRTPGEKRSREPFLLETSLPSVFAAGGARSGSIKRCTSAVGEGAMAVALVHQYLPMPACREPEDFALHRCKSSTNLSCPLQALNGEGQQEADDLQLETSWCHRMDLPGNKALNLLKTISIYW